MKKQVGLLYSLPQILWLLVFFAAPLCIIIVYSFLKKGLYGGVEPQFSLEAYTALANPNILLVTWRTLKISIIATALTLLIALPCGYSIARSKNQAARLFLVIVPFWTNFLVRIYAWIAILGNEGFLNDILRALHLTTESVQFLYNQTAVILVLVYMYLPYAILPLFSTIDKFDFTLLDAARDLGASRFQSYVRVLLPNIKSGLMTAGLFTFVPIFGAYAVPLLIGGKDSYMLGNIIADQLTKTRNWPLASSISMTVTILTTGLVFLIAMRKPREQKQVFDADPAFLQAVPAGKR
ncbi:MAG: ABC transporter permease [Rectinema sp.]|jgi:spermidine/putrescine transport system permease protein|uniref:ABC-type transporter, integral membrane subunit n=1 Tax=uncultured spirochete TaxID=156406 RepID=A0A3P3XT91_9SPIR|nr:ABC-type transporter, integral membrane subunit [uncultured spirochete]